MSCGALSGTLSAVTIVMVAGGVWTTLDKSCRFAGTRSRAWRRTSGAIASASGFGTAQQAAADAAVLKQVLQELP